ncbi:MAG: DUF2382 domain-containing protein [Tunicatimonas sp.]
MSQENKLPSQSIEGTESIVIPVVEEQVQVGVRQDVTGKVHIAKTVTTETVQVEAPYTQENVVIDRIAVNEYVDDVPPAVRYEGDTMIVPVLQEVLVKKTLLVEELHITKTRESTSEAQEVTLRKEVVNIQRD